MRLDEKDDRTLHRPLIIPVCMSSETPKRVINRHPRARVGIKRYGTTGTNQNLLNHYGCTGIHYPHQTPRLCMVSMRQVEARSKRQEEPGRGLGHEA